MQNGAKILIFSTAYYPFVGGAEVAIKEITDRLSEVQFDLITAKFKSGLPKFEKIGNVNVYRIGVGIPILDKLILPCCGAFKAVWLNRKNNYSSYWCMMVTFASGAAYIANIFSRKKVPIVLTLQEGDSEKYLKTKWLGLIELSWQLALDRGASVTAISNYLAERAKRLGYEREVKVIPNGVDVGKFSQEISKEEKIEVRKGLGVGDNGIALITASRLVAKNGVEDVIKAMAKLPKNVKFVILGEGELKEKLQKLAKDWKVSERVIWKGYVSHDELPKYLKACDIFIRASLSEGMGNSIIEAMASKVPVISTQVGGISDFLFSDPGTGLFIGTGFICLPQDPDSIVSAVKWVLSSPRKEDIKKAAYQMVVQKYDWNLIAGQMKEVFEGALAIKNK